MFDLLDALGDLHFIYHKCTTLQKHQLLNAVFDRNLFYYQSTYRTPTLQPVFMHSALILKEKKLLFVDEIKKTGLASRQVEVAGIEPASKHIRRKLSTCLFHYYLSAMNRE